MKDYLPLNNRQIFYQLINDPPLIHSSKPNSRFRNDLRSYKALCDLLTRARHEGRIPYDWIDDATRPVTVWQVHPNVSAYYRQELKDILNGYWRDLMQSQANHIEIVAEKNTLQNVLKSGRNGVLHPTDNRARSMLHPSAVQDCEAVQG